MIIDFKSMMTQISMLSQIFPSKCRNWGISDECYYLSVLFGISDKCNSENKMLRQIF